MSGLIVFLALCVGYAFAIKCYIGGIGTVNGKEMTRNITSAEMKSDAKCLSSRVVFNVPDTWTIITYSFVPSELPDGCRDLSNSTGQSTFCTCSTDLCNTKFLVN
ncbi:hypothetical protein M3Y94_01007400 [Aphelenchoides besseyi]|nr:hypothetical protein M3Y94_01007400 [Aphelenchoides besseyi]KAI6220452.1 hypothetical protein M3Y95_01041500 [Aphelenchoides besseyi]